MSRRIGFKIVLIFFLAVILTAGIVVGQNDNNAIQNYVGGIKFADPSSSTALANYYTNCTGIVSDIGIGEWDTYTAFPELYNFEKISYGGEDCIYFGLPTTNATYSMEASLTSPILSLNDSHDTYLIGFDYLSLRTIDLANKLTVYASNDGITYTKVGGIDKVYNINANNFVNVSYEIENSTKYIRIDVKAYYDNNTDLGVYLKNFNITPSSNYNYALPTFTVNFPSANPLKYNGFSQVPNYSVTASDLSYQYNTFEIVLNTSYKMVDSIEIGNYILLVVIYSADNVMVDITEQNFSIGKGDISNISVDYCATTNAIKINWIDAIDVYGNIITGEAGVITQTLTDVYPYSIIVDIAESTKYNAYTSSSKTLAVNSTCLIDTKNPTQSFVYDGTAKQIEYENFSSHTITVEYFKYNVHLASAPINAGKYTADIYVNDLFYKTINMVITPLEITAISLNGTLNNRYYDGTVYAYDYETEDFNLTGVLSGDTTVNISNLKFASNLGYTYLVFDEASFGGNYVLNENASVDKMYATITPVDIKLNSNIDLLENTIITVNDKQYDGTNTASINVIDMAERYIAAENAPLKFMGVPNNDSLIVSSLSVSFDSIYAGDKVSASLTITDLTCFDRFNADIYTDSGLVFGKIVTRKLDINTSLSTISVDTKTYDGTLNANISIGDLTFSGSIAPSDAAVMAENDNFTMTYTNAAYSNADAGINKIVNITGFILNCNNPQVSNIVNSYQINDIALTGTIEKAYVSVLDSYFHVISGGTIPNVSTNPEGIGYSSSYYDTEVNAQAGGSTGKISDFSTSTYNGIYYIRVAVDISELNYQILNGYDIIVLEITGTKKAQTLSFNIGSSFEYNDGDIYYQMAIGGRYIPNASSSSNGYATGLALNYELAQTGTLMTYAQGVYTARNEGTVIITVSQIGDNNYEQATAVSIRIRIVSRTISSVVSPVGALYYDDNMPQITGTADFTSDSVTGTYLASSGSLKSGTNIYLYNFVPSDKYLGEYNNIDVSLTVQKAALNIAISDFTIAYYTDVDYLDYANITLVKGANSTILKMSEFENLGIVYTLNSLTPIKEWTAGSYAVGYTDSSTNYITAATLDNYDISYTNSGFNVSITLSELTIKLKDFIKPYGEEISVNVNTDCTISGNYNSADVVTLLSTISVNKSARYDSKVGRYVMPISGIIDSSLAEKYEINLINGFMNVVKAPITVTANNAQSVYGSDVISSGFSISGFYIGADEEYFSRFITTVSSVSNSSNIGNYVITLNNLLASDCYDFILVNGTYTVSPAILTNITMSNAVLLYDGLAHSIYVSYDSNFWGELDIIYSSFDLVDAGRYPISAVIRKTNYQDLILNATLTISSLSIITSNRTDIAEIIMTDENAAGFDPDATLMVVKNEDAEAITNYSSYLVSTTDTVETLVGIYYYYLVINGNKQEISGNTQVRLKLEGINSDSDIRVIAIVDGAMTELSYVYDNGYVVFNNSGATEFGIMKSASKYSKDTASMILGIGVAIILMVVIYFIFFMNIGKSKRANDRSTRRHKRWA